MQLLLERGADVTLGITRDRRHCITRTHSTRGTVEGTHLLLKHGASIDVEDSRGETPRQVSLIDEGVY